MREATAAVVLTLVLVTSGLSILPGSQVRGDLDLPTLDWFQEGHNFHYRLVNSSISMEFNATITAIDGNELTWNLWDTVNGTEDLIEIRARNKSRENLNLTDVYTFMWVNETNVNTESAIIGGTEYQLNLLESTDSTLAFENDNRTFRYNATKGWLKEGVFRDLDLTWELLAVNEHPPVDDNIPPETDWCEESETATERPQWGASDEEARHKPWRHSRAIVCYNAPLVNDPADCEWKALAVSSVEWAAWLVNWQNPRFPYDHEATDTIEWDHGGNVILDGQLVPTVPISYHVLTDGDQTHLGVSGQKQGVKSVTYDLQSSTGDPRAENTWTC